MPVGGEQVGPGVSTPPVVEPSPPGSSPSTVQSLTALQISTGLVLDATSDRFLYLEGSATGGGASAIIHIGPTSGSTTQLVSSSAATGNTCIGVYVPKGWFVSGAFGNATFEQCSYW